MDDDGQPAASRPRSSKQEKVCHNCGTTRTPLWRKENGHHLCNACGIYLKARGTHRPVELIRAQMILSARRGTGPEGSGDGAGGSRARAVANQITRKSARKRTARASDGADDDDTFVSAKAARVAGLPRRPQLPPHSSEAASTLMRNRLLAYSLAMGYAGNGAGAAAGAGGGHGPMLMPLHGTNLAGDVGFRGGVGHHGFGGGAAASNGLARLHALHAAQQRLNAGGMFGGGGYAGALAAEHNAALARYFGGGGFEAVDGGYGSQDDEFMAYNGEGLHQGLYGAGDYGLQAGYGSGQTEEDEEDEDEDAQGDGGGDVDVGFNPELTTCPELKEDDDACAVASFLLMMRGAGPARRKPGAAVALPLLPQPAGAEGPRQQGQDADGVQPQVDTMVREGGSPSLRAATGAPAAAAGAAADATTAELQGSAAADAEAAADGTAAKEEERQQPPGAKSGASESEPADAAAAQPKPKLQPLTIQPATSSQDGPDCVRLPQLVLAAGSDSLLIQCEADGSVEEGPAAATAVAGPELAKHSPAGSDAGIDDETALETAAPLAGSAAAAGDSDEAEERPAQELIGALQQQQQQQQHVGYRARTLDPASLQVRGEPTREHVVAPLVIPPPRPQHGAGGRDRASMQVQVVAAADFSTASALPQGLDAGTALLGPDALRGLVARGMSPQSAVAVLQQQRAQQQLQQQQQQRLQLAAVTPGVGQGSQGTVGLSPLAAAGAGAAVPPGGHVPKVNPNSIAATASRHAATIAAGGCPPPPPRPPRNHRGPLLCSNCGTTQTPLWRKDRETGVTMCNACGIYKQTHGFDRPVGRNQAGAAAAPAGAAPAATKRGSGGGGRSGAAAVTAGNPDLAAVAAAAAASERAAGVPISSWTAVGTLNPPPSALGLHVGADDNWVGPAGGNEAQAGKGKSSRAASPSPAAAAAGVLGSRGGSAERSTSPRSVSVPRSNGSAAAADDVDGKAGPAAAAAAAAPAPAAKRPLDGTEQQQLQLRLLMEKERARGRRMDGTFSSWVMQTGPTLTNGGGARRALSPGGNADAGASGTEPASPTTRDGIPVIKPINVARQRLAQPQPGANGRQAAGLASKSPTSHSASPSPSQQPSQHSGGSVAATATTADGVEAGRGAQVAQGVRIHARPQQVQGQQMSALRAAGVSLGPRMAQRAADAADPGPDEAGAAAADTSQRDGGELCADREEVQRDVAAEQDDDANIEDTDAVEEARPRAAAAVAAAAGLRLREQQELLPGRSVSVPRLDQRDGGGVVLRELLAGGGYGAGGSPLTAAALQQQHELQRLELRAALAAADAGDMSRVALLLHHHQQQQQQRSQAALALLQQQDQIALALAARQAGYLGTFGEGPALGRGSGLGGGGGGGRGLSLDAAALLMAGAAGNGNGGGGGGGPRHALVGGGGGLGGLSVAQQQQLLAQQQQLLALHLRDAAAAGGLMQGGLRGLDRRL